MNIMKRTNAINNFVMSYLKLNFDRNIFVWWSPIQLSLITVNARLSATVLPLLFISVK